ncbi:MAG: hypothetical protein ACI80V_000754 [Rhodothermales bacterium]|jgi:hypothetical protein
MPDYVLAQLNVGRAKAPLDYPVMADFVANLDRINALAEAAPGFVWRLKTDDGDATTLRPFGDDTIVNLSVWEDLESLRRYVYESGHLEIMRRRREWFSRMIEASMVLWWIPSGHQPDEAEAKERLDALHADGPSPEAFSFGASFPAPGFQAGFG